MSRRGLIIGGVLAVVLLAAAVIGLWLAVDAERYRGRLVAAAEQAVGRTVTIDGPLEFRILPSPRLVVRGVGLANTDWGSRPQMLRIGRVEAAVDPLALMGGRVVIRYLDLDDTELLLETSPQGQTNWRFQGGGQEAGPAVALQGDVTVRDFTLIWRGAGGPLEVMVRRLGLTAADPGAALELDGEAVLRGETVNFSGSLTDLATLTAGRGVELDLALEARDSVVAVAGQVARPLEAGGLELSLKAAGEGVATLSALTDAALPAIGPWEVEAEVTDTDTGLRLSGLHAGLAAGSVTGEMELSGGGPRPRLSGRLQATGLRLPGPAGAGAAPGKRLFGTEPLPLGPLARVDLALDITAKDLGVASVILRRLAGTVSLEAARLRLAGVELELADSAFAGELELDGDAEPPALSLRLVSEALDMARLQELIAGHHWLRAKGRMEVDVTARGRTPAALAASLDGTVRLLVEQGEASTEDIDAMVGGLTRLVGTLVAADKERATLNCAVADFEVEQGVATARVLLADTEHSTVYGAGTVDLGKERLDLLFTPKPKAITLSVAVPVEVAGPLMAPSYNLEEMAVTRKAVGILAALGIISFPPAALLGLAELGTGSGNPCLAIAREHGEKAESGTGKGGNALDALGEGLRGLFE
ncbi:MAG: AsmA family protein [Gammaproteobacteria bacterium]|nr:AsmA family protein [Gammaproteobacteria bacterium]